VRCLCFGRWCMPWPMDDELRNEKRDMAPTASVKDDAGRVSPSHVNNWTPTCNCSNVPRTMSHARWLRLDVASNVAAVADSNRDCHIAPCYAAYVRALHGTASSGPTTLPCALASISQTIEGCHLPFRQAACQNMSSNHVQCDLCPCMPPAIP
jgi:hypothetical protein